MDWIKEQVVHKSDKHTRQTWDKPIEYWLCSLGFAVGYGSIWRFPYLVFENGGGAFMIAYSFCFIFVGIPLFYWESAIGQMVQKGIIASYNAIHPKFKGIGMGGVIISFFVACYYNLLLGISWNYLFYSFYIPLPWSDSSNTTLPGNSTGTSYSLAETNDFFYNRILEKSESISQLDGINPTIFFSYVFSLITCFLAISKGVSITGKLAYVTAVGPYVLLIILLLRGMFLDGAFKGLAYIFTFEWQALFKLEVWYKAAAQVLFQLSITMGTLVALASYRHKNESLRKSSAGIPIITALTGVLCALTVFCYMGHMSHELSIPVEKLPMAGPDLVFVAYPLALQLMPLPNFWSILFFLNLVFLGIDTQFALMESVSSYLEDEDIRIFGHKLTPFALRLIITIGCFIFGLVMMTRAGVYWFDFYDTFAATGPMLLLCVMEAFLFAFYPATEKFRVKIWEETQETVPTYFAPSLKYVATVVSTFLFIYAYFDLLGKLFKLPFWTAVLGICLLLIPVATVGHAYYKHKDDITTLREEKKPLIELEPMHHSEL